MHDQSNLNPPVLGQQLPVYPALPQIVRVTSAVPATTNIYSCKVQQFDLGIGDLRDREDAFVFDSNKTGMIPANYYARLVSSYASKPLYASAEILGSTPTSAVAVVLDERCIGGFIVVTRGIIQLRQGSLVRIITGQTIEGCCDCLDTTTTTTTTTTTVDPDIPYYYCMGYLVATDELAYFCVSLTTAALADMIDAGYIQFSDAQDTYEECIYGCVEYTFCVTLSDGGTECWVGLREQLLHPDPAIIGDVVSFFTGFPPGMIDPPNGDDPWPPNSEGAYLCSRVCGVIITTTTTPEDTTTTTPAGTTTTTTTP
jgi:hypothetical protein